MYLCPCHVPVLVPVPAPLSLLTSWSLPLSLLCSKTPPQPLPDISWSRGRARSVWDPFFSDFGTFLVTFLSILGVWVPKGARVPRRVKNGHGKPKESHPKLDPFLTYFRTCRAQFFHQLFGPFLTRPVDQFFGPRVSQMGPIFGRFW